MATSVQSPDATPAPLFQLEDGLAVRQYLLSDAAALAKAADNPKISQWMRNAFPSPYTEADAKAHIERCLDPEKWPARSTPGVPSDLSPEEAARKVPNHYAITLNGVAVGAFGFIIEQDAERTGNLGYWVGEEHWSKGIVTKVGKVFVPWIWETFPYLVRLEAGYYEGHPASGKVLAKLGFIHDFTWRAKIWKPKTGKVLDLHMWASYNPSWLASKAQHAS